MAEALSLWFSMRIRNKEIIRVVSKGHAAPCALALSSIKCNVVVFFKYQCGIATAKWSVDYLQSLLDFFLKEFNLYLERHKTVAISGCSLFTFK